MPFMVNPFAYHFLSMYHVLGFDLDTLRITFILTISFKLNIFFPYQVTPVCTCKQILSMHIIYSITVIWKLHISINGN